ncbi:hypothetical protein FHT40_006307 [Mycolicibacterium sp. BK556]|uniref:hypothetical protein n=1 Tax=unclassified Mycolicibacterium TaxID=2636767 RepID=UPI00161C7930|nr:MULTISPECIES: hypothetical protein [unclassified Mycolicibacterium]MBB3606616.1 hypothetical protein [Mycolicibacterium sp. BK556]MBB3636137.1 hypothetical protein [Mycolicibacterium sp. BK607]
MTTIATIKKLAASSAIAGVLGLGAVGLGLNFAAPGNADSGASGRSSAPDSSSATSGKLSTTPSRTASSGVAPNATLGSAPTTAVSGSPSRNSLPGEQELKKLINQLQKDPRLTELQQGNKQAISNFTTLLSDNFRVNRALTQ